MINGKFFEGSKLDYYICLKFETILKHSVVALRYLTFIRHLFMHDCFFFCCCFYGMLGVYSGALEKLQCLTINVFRLCHMYGYEDREVFMID